MKNVWKKFLLQESTSFVIQAPAKILRSAQTHNLKKYKLIFKRTSPAIEVKHTQMPL